MAADETAEKPVTPQKIVVDYQREDIQLKLTGEILLAPQLKPLPVIEKLAAIFNNYC